MSNLTVAALAALSPGEKLSAGRALYVRCNADRTVSATLRIKRAGRQIDLKSGVYKAPFNKPLIARIWRDADALRENADAHIEKKAERPTANAEGAAVNKGSTLGEVWSAYLVEVERNGRWTERNMKANKDRANAHFADWSAWDRPASELTAEDIKNLIAPLRAKTPAQAKKLCGLLRLALTFAKGRKIATSALLVDEALEELKVTAGKAPKGRHHHALLDIAELRTLYKSIDTLSGAVAVRAALKLQALTCVRTGEVIAAEWSEFDLDAREPTWTIPRARMKIKDTQRPAHVIHLPDAAVQLLRSLKGKDGFVFPGRAGYRDHVSDNTISQAMRRDLGMDGRMVPHGWRSALKTLATRAVGEDGRPSFAPSWIETVLDHQSSDNVEQAYNRGQHFAEAGRVLAWWSNTLTQAA